MADLKVLAFLQLKPANILTDILTKQNCCCRQDIPQILQTLLEGHTFLLNDTLRQPVTRTPEHWSNSSKI